MVVSVPYKLLFQANEEGGKFKRVAIEQLYLAALVGEDIEDVFFR